MSTVVANTVLYVICPATAMLSSSYVDEFGEYHVTESALYREQAELIDDAIKVFMPKFDGTKINRTQAYAAAKFLAKHVGFSLKVESMELCDHGLSAWLCEDPINHYPSI